MLVGAVAAVVAARLQLPAEEYERGQVNLGRVCATVAGFGSWRSAQEGIRPLTTLLLRSAVPIVASAAALGRLEAARLAIAPLVLGINGVGSFLLPVYARRNAESPGVVIRIGRSGRRARRAVPGLRRRRDLECPCSIMSFITGGGLAVDRWAVAGWCVFAAMFAAGIPAGSVLLARRKSLMVFRFRALDSGLGLLLALFLLAVGGPSYGAVRTGGRRRRRRGVPLGASRSP